MTAVVVADAPGQDKRLQRALSSVLDQRGVDFEALVVTAAREVDPATSDPRVRQICLERPPGGQVDLAAARNAGAAAARSRWVAFLDLDEVWAPDCLSAHLAALNDHPGARWSIAGSVSFTEGQREVVEQIHGHWSPSAAGDVPTTSAVVFDRASLQQPGGLGHGPPVVVDRPLVATSTRPVQRRLGGLADWKARSRVPLSWRAEVSAWLPGALASSSELADPVASPALVDLGWPALPGVHQVTAPGAVEVMMDGLAKGEGGTVITPNLHHLWTLRRSPELAQCYRSAALIVSDGAPLVWASRLRGDPVPERVAGSDLVWFLAAAAAQRGTRLFLLGGLPGSAEATAECLSQRFPGLVVAGTACPPLGFEHDPQQMAELQDALSIAQPDIVLVALGAPKQEQLAQRLIDTMPSVWFVGVGGAFEMAAGQVRRAPGWIGSLGMEWAYRLAQEPRRLAQRYLVHDLPVAARLLGRAALVAASTR